MFLTPEQLQELVDIVDKHHAAFVANFVSPQALTDAQVARLKAAGLLSPQAQTMREAYLLGMVAAQLPAGGSDVTYAQLAQRLRKDPVPLSAQERHAIGVAQLSAGQYISGIGARVAGEVGSGVMQVDAATRAADREAYEETTAQAVAQRRGTKGLASDLGHRIKDWARSLERVANTELAMAYQAGTAQVIAKQHGDDARVAKVVSDDACQLCKSLLLDEGGRPKIFSLAELEANGTNVGRKAAEARATTGPLHPSCVARGTLIATNDGWKEVSEIRPGDLVWTHLGRLQRVRARWTTPYDGTMVNIQHPVGHCLSLTANHPVLGTGGWIEAGSLQTGANQLHGLLDVPIKVPASADLATHDAPAQRGQNVRLAEVLRILPVGEVPVTAVYLDGQIFLGEGDVDHKNVDGHSGNRRESLLPESLENSLLVGTFEPSAVGYCALEQVGALPGAPADAVVRRFGQVSTLRRVYPLPPGTHKFATTSWWNALFTQDDGHPGAAQALVHGDGVVAQARFGQADDLSDVCGGATRQDDAELSTKHLPDDPVRHPPLQRESNGGRSFSVGRENGVGRQVVPTVAAQVPVWRNLLEVLLDGSKRHLPQGGNLAWAHVVLEVHLLDCGRIHFGHPPSPVSDAHEVAPCVAGVLDTVVAHCSDEVNAIVHNLTVEEDESFVANGLVVHNCACTLVHVPAGMTFDASGKLVADHA